MKPFKVTRPFQVKVTVALILGMLFPLLLSNLLIYKFTLDSSFRGLRDRLKMIAQIATELVDPETLREVPLNRQGVYAPSFQAIAQKLKKIQKINPQINSIYILTKTDKEGLWQFVVDPDPSTRIGDQVLHSFPGDTYNASRFPEMLLGYDGPSADRKLQIDEWGTTLSGYAPIYDRQGKAMAVLGVDILADDVRQMQIEVRRRTVFVVLIGLCLCLVLGTLLSSRITDPVEKLVDGTRRIADGQMNVLVEIPTKDEIGELAASFNDMARNLKESRRKILGYFYNTIRSMVRILEIKDQYTRGHSESVARYAAKIATRMGFPKETVKIFRRMALLHDIGKIGIKDHVLNKKEPLTAEEWDSIRKHPLIGENILRPILGNDEMIDIIRHHHERPDGKGYPHQLNSDKINIFASIVAVADAYSAMTSDRAYRKGLSREEAIAELEHHKGTQFHPRVVEVFLEILEEEKQAGNS